MIIKPLETTEEIRGKAFVHCTAWKEAYAGIVDQSFLDGRTPELSESFAQRAFDQGYASLIAVDDGKVCGFAD
ncbi:MAG: GNAT family N-acetyltransferase, partial [Firmicutes bacterium]|nr:GNAT family N-acetyltransferase [Bacillota bacterium]